MKQAVILVGVNGLFWLAWAFGCYQTVYLQSIGFTASQMGLVNAISSGVGIASVAFWGMVSDKIGSLRRVLIIVVAAAAVLYALVPMIPVNPAFLLMAYIPAVNFFRGSNATFAENILVRNCNELGLNFGVLRSMGSLLFTLGSLVIAALLPAVGVENTFRITGVMMLPVIVCTLFAREPNAKAAPKGQKQKLDLSPLLKNKAYLIFLGFTLLFYVAASCEANFIPYFMEQSGVPPTTYGVVLAFRAFLEIPFLLLMVKLRRKFPLRVLVAVSAALMALECLGFSLFVTNLATMLVFCTFFGLGNGLFIGSSLNYVYELAPDHLKATAQAFYASISSVAGILGNILGGLTFDALGAKTFYLGVGVIYLVAVGVFVLSFLPKRKHPAQAAES